MRNLCIIPARGGSKRIKRKNIRNFFGKPIMIYSIETALKSGLFENVMVSTEDEEIAHLAIQNGAEVPFFRSFKSADDYATTADVITEVLEKYNELGITFDNICCLYATAPFVNAKRLLEGFEALNIKDINTVIPITEFEYPIFRSLKMDKKQNVSLIWPEYTNTRSQDIKNTYHDAGQWYWIKVKAFQDDKNLINQSSYGICLNKLEVQDIDDENDWKIAEIKYEILQGIR